MEKTQLIADEMTVLLRQLVMQNQLIMAAQVLKAYFLRQWKIDEELATRYVRYYFTKHYPKQLEQHIKRQYRAR